MTRTLTEGTHVRGAAQWYPNPLSLSGPIADVRYIELKEIMRPAAPSVATGTDMAGAARELASAGSSYLLVAGERGLAGIITGRDLAACVGEGHSTGECLVTCHMSSPVVTASSRVGVLDASHLISEKGVKSLPLVEGGELVGSVSIADIVSMLDRELHRALTPAGGDVAGC